MKECRIENVNSLNFIFGWIPEYTQTYIIICIWIILWSVKLFANLSIRDLITTAIYHCNHFQVKWEYSWSISLAILKECNLSSKSWFTVTRFTVGHGLLQLAPSHHGNKLCLTNYTCHTKHITIRNIKSRVVRFCTRQRQPRSQLCAASWPSYLC